MPDAETVGGEETGACGLPGKEVASDAPRDELDGLTAGGLRLETAELVSVGFDAPKPEETTPAVPEAGRPEPAGPLALTRPEAEVADDACEPAPELLRDVGVPGTGKTTDAERAVLVLWESVPPEPRDAREFGKLMTVV